MFKKANETGKNLIKESKKVNESLKKLHKNIFGLITETDEKNEKMLGEINGKIENLEVEIKKRKADTSYFCWAFGCKDDITE